MGEIHQNRHVALFLRDQAALLATQGRANGPWTGMPAHDLLRLPVEMQIVIKFVPSVNQRFQIIYEYISVLMKNKTVFLEAFI